MKKGNRTCFTFFPDYKGCTSTRDHIERTQLKKKKRIKNKKKFGFLKKEYRIFDFKRRSFRTRENKKKSQLKKEKYILSFFDLNKEQEIFSYRLTNGNWF